MAVMYDPTTDMVRFRLAPAKNPIARLSIDLAILTDRETGKVVGIDVMDLTTFAEDHYKGEFPVDAQGNELFWSLKRSLIKDLGMLANNISVHSKALTA